MTSAFKKYGLKNIAVKEATYERLVRRKRYGEQSFDSVINEILDNNKEVVRK